MPKNPESERARQRLQAELANATSELAAAMNEQDLAVIRNDPNFAQLDAKVNAAHAARRQAIDALVNWRAGARK